MTTKTIATVFDVGQPDQRGNRYVNVFFSDDTAGWIGAKGERAEQHHTALSALKDQEAEYRLEETGQTQKGKPKFKILAYPGWEPEAAKIWSMESPKSAWKESWNYTEDGVRFSDERVDRRRALEMAVARLTTTDASVEGILGVAEDIYQWLRRTVGAPVPVTGTTTAATSTSLGEIGSAVAPTSSGDGGGSSPSDGQDIQPSPSSDHSHRLGATRDDGTRRCILAGCDYAEVAA